MLLFINSVHRHLTLFVKYFKDIPPEHQRIFYCKIAQHIKVTCELKKKERKKERRARDKGARHHIYPYL